MRLVLKGFLGVRMSYSIVIGESVFKVFTKALKVDFVRVGNCSECLKFLGFSQSTMNIKAIIRLSHIKSFMMFRYASKVNLALVCICLVNAKNKALRLHNGSLISVWDVWSYYLHSLTAIALGAIL